MLKLVMQSVLADLQDPWTVWVQHLCGAEGIGTLNKRQATVRRSLTDSAVASVLSLMRAHSSLICMPQPDCWFKLNPYVNDSSLCGVLSRFRAGDVGLGNRRPNQFGQSYKFCPLCSADGLDMPLNEWHVVLECPSVDFDRRVTGILEFTNKFPSSRKKFLLLKDYLGGDQASKDVMHQRSAALDSVLASWLGKVERL